MRKIINNFLFQERNGFSGVNHVLIAIMLFVALFFIPITPIEEIVKQLQENYISLVLSFLVIIGAALLPDMDNLKSDGGSAASWDLSILGSIISSLMVTVSSIMTSFFHGKRDVKPYTQHRFFWHTLIVPVIIFLLVFFFVGEGDQKIWEVFTSASDNHNISYAFSYIIVVFFGTICVFVGSGLLLKKLKKFLPFINFNVNIIAILLSLLFLGVSIGASCQSNIKFYGECIAIGYLFHIIGDLFADGGVPLLFPIPIRGQFWHRIKLLPVTVKTGSTLETLLKVVFVTIDIILVYILITVKII